MADKQADKRQRMLRVPIQAHFMPPLKLRGKLQGVIPEKNRTIVFCTPEDDGKIILPKVIKKMVSFGGEQSRKPEYYLFASEEGGPQPTFSSAVEGQITGWSKGFSRLITGIGGEKLEGYAVPEYRVRPQGKRVRFRAKELCRIDVRYSRDGRKAYLTITQHQIVGENKDEPCYQMDEIFQITLDFSSDISYSKVLKQALQEAELEHFRVPATTAVELGYIFPNGARPKSPLISEFSNKQRATAPIYFRYGGEEDDEPGATDAEVALPAETVTQAVTEKKKKTSKKTTGQTE